ncbi:hypothetical protein HOK51_01640 [Candidatus Woesearchaeota archaeon]|jgi:hypothetical protein|nr:hypothetical protein [Candidatus Woesearchaeota archaeon]MBT7368670.1 hypothetical protein [Candidatus Woesearchaeota archaeon]
MGIFGGQWYPHRVMKVVPLEVSNERVKEIISTDDYSKLPQNLKTILTQGILRTSKTQTTDYSILMSVTDYEDHNPLEGRTGVLLYQGEPVSVEIGGKEFVVEIKGVGCPDGDNTKTDDVIRSGYFGQSVKRFGCASESEGKRELENLELQRKENAKTFLEGDSVRAAGVFIYENDVDYGYSSDRQDQAYLIRLAPSNVRSSFNSNPAFPKPENREMLLAKTLGKHYAELAKLDGILLHSTIHPENILFTGSKYVLTDFADCRRLDQIEKPLDFLKQVLEKISEVPNFSEQAQNRFYETIATELNADWNIESGYEGFIDSIWRCFFAEKVFEIRKNNHEQYKKLDDFFTNDKLDIDEIEKEILEKKVEKISEYETSVENSKTYIGELNSRMTELILVGDNGELAKTKYPEHFDFQTGQDALDYIQSELNQKRGHLKGAEERYEESKTKIKLLYQAGSDFEKIFAADSSQVPFRLKGMVRSATHYLEMEIQVLSVLDTDEAKENLVAAQQNLEIANADLEDPIALMNKLRENKDYFNQLIELPYTK